MSSITGKDSKKKTTVQVKAKLANSRRKSNSLVISQQVLNQDKRSGTLSSSIIVGQQQLTIAQQRAQKEIHKNINKVSAFYQIDEVPITNRKKSVEQLIDPDKFKSSVLRDIEPDIKVEASQFEMNTFQFAYKRMEQVIRQLEMDEKYNQRNSMLRPSKNPCPYHIEQQIAYISLKDYTPFCPKCFNMHNESQQAILTMQTAKKKMQSKLIDLTTQIEQKIKQKKSLQGIHHQALQVIEQQKKQFIKTQQQKIQILKDYLDQKLNQLITQYDIKIQKDVLKINAGLKKLQRQIYENSTLVGQIGKLRMELIRDRVPSLLEKLMQGGKFCTFHHYMDQGAESRIAKVDPEQYRQFKPMLELDPCNIVLFNQCIYILIEKQQDELIQRMALLNNSIIVSSPPKKENIKQINKSKQGWTPKYNNHSRQRGDQSQSDSDQEVKQKMMTRGGFDMKEIQKRAPVVRHKIIVPRWMSRRLGIYDIAAKQWHFKTIPSLDQHFLPFSSFAYTPSSHDIFILGGLSEQVPRKPMFSDQCISIKKQTNIQYQNSFKFHNNNSINANRSQTPNPTRISDNTRMKNAFTNSFDVFYTAQRHANMNFARSSFPSIYKDGKIFVFGGNHLSKTPLSECEVYDIRKNQWKKIASMSTGRAGSAACALSNDYIYIIGGRTSSSSQQQQQQQQQSSPTHSKTTGSSIQYYNSRSNVWIQLRVRLPMQLQYLTCCQVAQSKIMIFGGSKIKSRFDTNENFTTQNSQSNVTSSKLGGDTSSKQKRDALQGRNDIFLLDTSKTKVEKVGSGDFKMQWMKGFLTVYPTFITQDKKIFIVSEENKLDQPPQVVQFDMNQLLKQAIAN